VLTALGRAVLGDGGPVDWRALESHDAIRKLISELIPGYEPIADIGKSKQEFHITGRQLDQRRFATPSGKAAFHAVAIPSRPTGREQLQLMTIRSRSVNTVVYEDYDLYRGQDRRDVILMHPDDIRRPVCNQPVRVASTTGEITPARAAVRRPPG
jgi:hypothetical protein